MQTQRKVGITESPPASKASGNCQHDTAHLERLATLGAHSAGLAHELKNALVPIKTILQLQLERQPDAQLGEMAQRELARIDSLLSQMLLLSAPAPLHNQEVRMHELLAYTLKLLAKLAAEKRVQVAQSYGASADRVMGNSFELQQAFMNLVMNAFDAMEGGGSLTVSTRQVTAGEANRLGRHGRLLCIEVADTGCGIAPENLPRLFEPFFTTRSSGTGLGLGITHRIIADHGGSISVESAPGAGTRFSVLLPG